MKFIIPRPLKLEHEELHEQLRLRISQVWRIGKISRNTRDSRTS